MVNGRNTFMFQRKRPGFEEIVHYSSQPGN